MFTYFLKRYKRRKLEAVLAMRLLRNETIGFFLLFESREAPPCIIDCAAVETMRGIKNKKSF